MKDLDLSKTVYQKINNDETLLIARSENGGFFLIQIKYEGKELITQAVYMIAGIPNDIELSDFSITPVLSSAGFEKSLKIDTYIIKSKDRVLLYDATLRTILYPKIHFDKAYLGLSDLYEENDSNNLIREDVKHSPFPDNFVLRIKTDVGDHIYPIFYRSGRLKTIYRSLEGIKSEYFMEGISDYKIFENSIEGDQEKLKYIVDKINSNYSSYSVREVGHNIILSLQKK